MRKLLIPGYAEREAERMRLLDVDRAPERRKTDAYRTYQREWKRANKDGSGAT